MTNTTRSSLRLHYQPLINEKKENPKNMWRNINKVLDKATNSTTIMQIRDGSKIVSDSKQIANALNSYFVNIGQSLLAELKLNLAMILFAIFIIEQMKQPSSSNM